MDSYPWRSMALPFVAPRDCKGRTFPTCLNANAEFAVVFGDLSLRIRLKAMERIDQMAKEYIPENAVSSSVSYDEVSSRLQVEDVDEVAGACYYMYRVKVDCKVTFQEMRGNRLSRTGRLLAPVPVKKRVLKVNLTACERVGERDLSFRRALRKFVTYEYAYNVAVARLRNMFDGADEHIASRALQCLLSESRETAMAMMADFMGLRSPFYIISTHSCQR